MKMHHLLPLLPLFLFLSASAPAAPSAPSGIPAWDTAWSFDPAPDTPTYRSLEPGLVAFWTDFLGAPPAGLEAVAPDFDLVLTDLWMPEMDGRDLVRAIRADPALAHLPVHLVTADVEARHEAPADGFTGILLKPLALDSLQALFEQRTETETP